MLLAEQNKIYIKDYQQILMLESSFVRIQMDQYQLLIKGREFKIEYFDHNEIHLHGSIQVIEYV